MSSDAIGLPPRSTESLSPFIDWRDDGPALETLVGQQQPSLLRDLLTAPEAVSARLLGSGSARLVQSSLGLLAASSALSGGLIAIALEASVAKMAVLVPVSLLIAMVAALGPIAAVAIVLGVRVPWVKLSGTLVAAMAAGSLSTCAVTPFAVVLHRFDAEWAGPLAVVSAFVLAGVVAGQRTRQLLLQLARTGDERVALLARVATVLVAFTTALSLWLLWSAGLSR